MPIKNVIVELRRRPEFEASLFAAGVAASDLPAFTAAVAPVAGLTLDPSFAPVTLPSLAAGGTPSAAAAATEMMIPDFDVETVLVRGTMEEEAFDAEMFAAGPQGDVAGVFADPVIEPCITCGPAPLGTAADVARLLDVPSLRRAGMDGRGVLLAIVDTGVNLAHLRTRGLNPRFSGERSWTPPLQPGQTPMTPGQMPVGHGTMCAYDALIAAPKATLIDVAILASRRPGGSTMDGLLSDAVLGYSFLLRLIRGLGRPGDFHSLVVNNSWGMFQASWDFPPGHPGNYSDNPNHPFNRIVGTLERSGADILFAAGNCGRECPDRRCGTDVDAGIYGANSHPAVLTVAGVDVRKQRVGYSTRGPGYLEPRKPDVCGFTHFAGSQVYPADGGTSAATPVVAGLVAAFRSRFPMSPNRTPAALRDLVRRTAENVGPGGFDNDTGFGIVNGSRLARSALTTAAAEEDGGGDQADLAGEAPAGGGEEEFMEALRAFGLAAEPTEGAEAGGCASCVEPAPISAGGEQAMNGNDQEFMQALQAFGFQGGGGAEFGAEFSGGEFGAEFGGSEFGGGFGAGGVESGGTDQEFMQALAAYGGSSTGASFGGGAAGGFGGGMEAGFGAGATAADFTAAPSAADLCRVWRTARPIVMRILPFLAALPGIGAPVAAAFRALGTILDALCGGRIPIPQLCARWRGGLRVIVVRVANVVGRIPFIGGAAKRALLALVAAIDALCRLA